MLKANAVNRKWILDGGIPRSKETGGDLGVRNRVPELEVKYSKYLDGRTI